MIGTAFQNVGVEKTISVQDIKASGLTGVDWTFETEAGDRLMVWDSSSQMYTQEFMYSGDSASQAMTEYGAEPGTWFDMNEFATAEYDLKNGDAFWILSSAPNASVTIAGEVPTDVDAITIRTGYNMIGNPFPIEVDVNDMFTVTGLTGVDWTFETEAGDRLMIWDPVSKMYTTELLYTGDTPSQAMTEYGAEPSTWFDMNEFATATTKIPVGGAFWIKSSGEGTLTFK